MIDRLTDTRHSRDLLSRLEGRIGRRAMLADSNDGMDWPNRRVYLFFFEA